MFLFLDMVSTGVLQFSETGKKWKSVFVALKNNLLFYYKDENVLFLFLSVMDRPAFQLERFV